MTTVTASDLRDEALKKIGRNMVSVQKLEAALKTLIVRSDMRGYVSEIVERNKRRIKDVSRRPMGWLVDDFFNSVYSDTQQEPERSDNLNEAWMSFTIRIETDNETKQEQKTALSLLVRERNTLIHKRLQGFDTDSVDSCKALIQFLDEQNERLEPHRVRFMQFVAELDKAQAEILAALEVAILASDKESDDPA